MHQSTLAATLGITPHYHGTPCRKYGHILRYTNNGKCAICMRANSKKWKHANPERNREHGRKYYASEHGGTIARAASKRHADRNREYYREYGRAWRAAKKAGIDTRLARDLGLLPRLDTFVPPLQDT